MSPIPRKLLSISLLVGGAFDGLLAVAILYFPEAVAGLVGLSPPAEILYMDLTAVLLLTIALFQFVSAFAVEQVPGLASVAAAGRLLGFFLLAAAWNSGYPASLLWVGLWFLALAVSHAALLVWGLMAAPAGDAETA